MSDWKLRIAELLPAICHTAFSRARHFVIDKLNFANDPVPPSLQAARTNFRRVFANTNHIRA